jgi:polysaccharide chain length determinant protein (PEP-CTERM system associated)
MYEQVETLRSYLRMAWLYRWHALLIAAVACTAGWLFVYTIPPSYEVTTRIYIDTNSLMNALLRGLALEGSMLSDADALLRRTLLTRPNIEELARRTDLDLTTKTPREFDRLVDDLAARIAVSSNRADRNNFLIAFSDKDPKLAKRVVDELLNTFLETALGTNRQDTASTQKFIDQQIAEYEQKMVAAEDRLKEFRQRNVQFLTSSQEGYFSRLQTARADLQAAQLQLDEAVNRRAQLAQQIESGADAFATDPGLLSSPELSGIDARITGLQQKVDELLLNYTEKHPDVVAARQTIAQLEAQRARVIEEMQSSAAEQSSLIPSATDSPFKQQMKMALLDADATVASLRTRVGEFERRVEELGKLVDTVPEVETELGRLDRDYTVLKQQHGELVARREQMRLGYVAGQSGESVEIKVLEPPREPLNPTGPKRLLLLSITFAVSLGAAGALAFLLSQLTPRVFTGRELKELLGLPVMGTVSLFGGKHYRKQRITELVAFSMGIFGLSLVYLSLVTLQLMDVDVHHYIASLIELVA